MPSEHTSGTSTADRPTFPGLREDIGEDPARYLCTDIAVGPLIDGMRDPERAAAWLAVARNVGAADRVRDALEAKRDALRRADS